MALEELKKQLEERLSQIEEVQLIEYNSEILSSLKQFALNFVDVYNENIPYVRQAEAIWKTLSQVRSQFPEVINRNLFDQIDDTAQKWYQQQNKKASMLADVYGRKIYTAAYEFRAEVLRTQGATMEVVYVTPSGKIYKVPEENVIKKLKFTYSSSNELIGRYEFSERWLKENAEQIPISPQLQELFNKQIKKLFDSTHLNRGDISEAYAVLGLRGASRNLNNQFIKFLKQVDNISGALQGDYSESLSQTYEIKSKKASTLSLDPLLRLAKEILDSKTEKAEIQAIKQEKAKLKNQGASRYSDEIIKEVESYLTIPKK